MLNDEIEALQRQSLSIYNQLGAFIEAVTNNHAQQEQQEKVAQEEARRAAEVSVQEPTPAEAAAVAKLDSRPLTREETTKLLLLLSRAAAAGLVDPDVRKCVYYCSAH
jgi:type V secretory pathway adhesin AidA